ncbi:thiazolylpeptide-type bacteriocin [Streptomyces tateyamensis]|uniref:Thiazolylpeptide-type bacteriocin n=1 Tax=Streptomyces tateyamensis TaxID=565073 RepID=A0A2V4NJ18_9ACTN|nr:thiazolylpeptide-type bacteriocin [Streptomyces tateyamensis]PYC79468.1 thiazolylpeptide-type bacteriocin [Streptomyces tateyamensis]
MAGTTRTSGTTGSTGTESFELQDLDLSGLTVSSLRESAALPEGGASWGSSSCQVSSSCSMPPVPESA